MNESILKAKNILFSYLDSVFSDDFGDKKNIFIETCSKIFNQIDILSNGGYIEKDEDLLQKCKILLDFLRNIYFEIPISKELIEFSITFSIVLFNWNENTFKDEEIFIQSKKVEFTYEEKHNFIELMNQSKKLLHMIKHQNSYSFVPELSRHYLKTFCDQEDKKE